jgi:uncharacterized membrane protein YhiD involved in acid resistance
MLDFLTLQTSSAHPSIVSIFYTVLLSFLLSTAIALTYEKTFRGLSYSRNFIQAIILCSIVAGMVMQAIGENPLRGLGVLGALAIIRFRTVFKDPRDIIFIFAAMAAGIACGVFGYTVAIVGTLAFCIAAFVLHFSPFGEERYFDGILRFNMSNAGKSRIALEEIMKEYCKNFALITLRETGQGERLEYAYHVKLRKGKKKDEFVNKIVGIESVRDTHLMLQETTVEI